MPNKYRYSQSLFEAKLIFWLFLVFSLWHIYHLVTANDYLTQSRTGLFILGEILGLFISWNFAYSPQKAFNDQVAEKKLITNTSGWRGRYFNYRLILTSGVELMVNKEIFAMIQKGDEISGFYRTFDKQVIQFTSEMPEERQRAKNLIELAHQEEKLAKKKRWQTLIFLAIFILLLIYGYLSGKLY